MTQWERERAVQQEKIINLENSNKELLRNYENEIARLREDNE